MQGPTLSSQTDYEITVVAESFLGGVSDEYIHDLTVAPHNLSVPPLNLYFSPLNMTSSWDTYEITLSIPEA